VLRKIVYRDRLIKLLATLRDGPRQQQGNAHDAMSDHERDRCSLLVGECEELRRKIAYDVTIERSAVSDPNTVED
jgi:hypothetical protein